MGGREEQNNARRAPQRSCAGRWAARSLKTFWQPWESRAHPGGEPNPAPLAFRSCAAGALLLRRRLPVAVPVTARCCPCSCSTSPPFLLIINFKSHIYIIVNTRYLEIQFGRTLYTKCTGCRSPRNSSPENSSYLRCRWRLRWPHTGVCWCCQHFRWSSISSWTPWCIK